MKLVMTAVRKTPVYLFESEREVIRRLMMLHVDPEEVARVFDVSVTTVHAAAKDPQAVSSAYSDLTGYAKPAVMTESQMERVELLARDAPFCHPGVYEEISGMLVRMDIATPQQLAERKAAAKAPGTTLGKNLFALLASAEFASAVRSVVAAELAELRAAGKVLWVSPPDAGDNS